MGAYASIEYSNIRNSSGVAIAEMFSTARAPYHATLTYAINHAKKLRNLHTDYHRGSGPFLAKCSCGAASGRWRSRLGRSVVKDTGKSGLSGFLFFLPSKAKEKATFTCADIHPSRQFRTPTLAVCHACDFFPFK